MLTAQTIKLMSDEHLIQSARAEVCSLTSTPLELELLDRFERVCDQLPERQGGIELVEEYEITPEEARSLVESHPGSVKEMAKLLSVLSDEDIQTPKQLKALIDFSLKFRAFANDAGDVFARLNEFITTINQE